MDFAIREFPAGTDTGTLIAGRDWNGKVAADGTRQVFLDFVVPGNGFLAARLRMAPN